MKMSRWIAVTLGLIGLMSAPGVSRADFAITPGNHPQIDENVLLNNGQVGNTIFGMTNQTAIDVGFTSAAQTLTAPSNGQARVEAVTGDLLGLDSIFIPGGTFTSLIFNMNSGSGVASITVNGFDASNNPETLTVSNLAIGNGSNFFTITAINGEKITSVSFSTPGGIRDLRQIRIGGASVPEPASVALLGLGLGGALVARRRRSAKA